MHQLTLDITSHIMGAPRMGSAAVSAASSSPAGSAAVPAASSSLPSLGSAAVSAASSSAPGAPRFRAASSPLPPGGPVSPCPRGQSSVSPPPPGGSKGRAHCWQLLAIMQDGTWRTPYELHELTGIGILSITARLRNLREPQYGACQLNVRQRQGAPTQTYEYQIIPPMGAAVSAASSSVPVRVRPCKSN